MIVQNWLVWIAYIVDVDATSEIQGIQKLIFLVNVEISAVTLKNVVDLLQIVIVHDAKNV